MLDRAQLLHKFGETAGHVAAMTGEQPDAIAALERQAPEAVVLQLENLPARLKYALRRRGEH